jgi:hypothetical protein
MSNPYHVPAGRQRLSPQIYRRRRIVALAALVLVAIGTYRLASAILGGSDATEAAKPVPSTNLVVSDGSTPVTAASTTSTTAAPKEPVVPTAATPATLLIAGDSDAGTFGPYLETLMNQTGVVTTKLDYKVSSGLSRPDFFDWPAHFDEILPTINPDIVVVTFGGNDAQGLSELGGNFIEQQPTGEVGGDVDWRAEYGRRVGAAMDQLAAGNRTLIWVGIPNDDSAEVTARMRVQDEVVRAEAAKRPDVVFIDTWARFSGISGGWAQFVIDPRDGVGKDVRADDGFHLNTTGAEILALDIAEAIRTDLRTRGAAF